MQSLLVRAKTALLRFWDSGQTGEKIVVIAITGAIMFLFIIGHLIGNLQVFEGPDKFNAYGRLLRVEPLLLWTVRLSLLAAVVLHRYHGFGCQLALRKKKARPVGYAKKESIGSSYASRTMYWSGPIILAFLIFHLLHLTAWSGATADIPRGRRLRKFW